MDREVLVSATDLAKSFGQTMALASASVTFRRGEVHALLGGNGAGKSTLISLLDRVLDPDSGVLEIHATKVAVVHQELAVLPDLTVAENIELPFQTAMRFTWGHAAAQSAEALSLLGASGRAIDPNALVSELPLHQRQLVEIARSLRSGADLILLDEPTASLTADETARLFDVVREMTSRGIGVVIVSHRMHEIRQIADVATILRDGRTVITGVPLGSLTDAQILKEMFGSAFRGDLAAVRDRAVRSTEPPRLLLRHAPSGVVVSVAPGEALGLAGAPIGPARLMDAVFGVRRDADWALEIDGVPWRPRSPRAAVLGGVGFVSGDRAGKGALPDLTIAENAVMAEEVIGRGFLHSRTARAAVLRHAQELGFSHVDLDAKPESLSGGTLQKVLIARWLDQPIRVLVLEEPTRGVDVKTKSELYDIIRRLTDSGITVLWWSTEASELLAVADRILAFSVEGMPTTVRDAGTTDETSLIADTGTAA